MKGILISYAVKNNLRIQTLWDNLEGEKKNKEGGSAEEEAFSREDYIVLSQIAGEVTIEKLNDLIELLDKTINTALNSPSRRTLIEVALIQSAMPSMKDRISELQSKIDERIAQLEGLQSDEKIIDTYKEQI